MASIHNDRSDSDGISFRPDNVVGIMIVASPASMSRFAYTHYDRSPGFLPHYCSLISISLAGIVVNMYKDADTTAVEAQRRLVTSWSP
jgi:hypothetical protein